MALDPEKDSMLEALAKLGGIQREVMAREFGQEQGMSAASGVEVSGAVRTDERFHRRIGHERIRHARRARSAVPGDDEFDLAVAEESRECNPLIQNVLRRLAE